LHLEVDEANATQSKQCVADSICRAVVVTQQQRRLQLLTRCKTAGSQLSLEVIVDVDGIKTFGYRVALQRRITLEF
jgi:hypothetical protein